MNLSLVDESASTEEKIQWYKKHNYFCAKPYHTLQLQLHPSGQIQSKPCCNYPGDLGTDLLAQQFRSIKQDIERGVQHSGCQKCWVTEKTNDHSERIRDMAYGPARFINDFVAQGKINQFNLGVKFSNFCNLACRSCWADCSSTYAQLVGQRVSPSVSTDISDDPVTWQTLLDITARAVEQHPEVAIGLIGGESMIQAGAEKYVEFLKSLPNSKNIILGMTSNFTTLNPRLLKHIDHFRRFDITASIDSVGQNYHYVRWPAQFSKIESNLADWVEIRRGRTNTTFTVASVWGLNNIFYINEYLDFLTQCYQTHPDMVVHVLHLESPQVLSMENLPVRYRAGLLPYIQQALAHSVFEHVTAAPMRVFLQGVERLLISDAVVHDLFDGFLSFTADFDQRTKCRFEEYNARFYQTLSPADQAQYQAYLK